MSTIKIEFPAGDARAALLLGAALSEYGRGDERLESERPAYTSPAADEDTAPTRGSMFDESDSAPERGEYDGGQAAGLETDEHDVAFDSAFCGEATEPFYSSGKRKGQWKKKRGVSEDDYDRWYASQLKAPAQAETAEESHPDPVNTGAAFSSQQPSGPTNGGALMEWISEKTAAGQLQQQDVDAAYRNAGVQIGDLFQGSPDDQARVVGTVYQILNGYLRA